MRNSATALLLAVGLASAGNATVQTLAADTLTAKRDSITLTNGAVINKNGHTLTCTDITQTSGTINYRNFP